MLNLFNPFDKFAYSPLKFYTLGAFEIADKPSADHIILGFVGVFDNEVELPHYRHSFGVRRNFTHVPENGYMLVITELRVAIYHLVRFGIHYPARVGGSGAHDLFTRRTTLSRLNV